MKRHPSRRACRGQRNAPALQIVTAPRAPLSVNAQHVADTLTDCLARTVAGEFVGAVVVCANLAGELHTRLCGSYLPNTTSPTPAPATPRQAAINTLKLQLDTLHDAIDEQCDADAAEALLDRVGAIRETLMRLQYDLPATVGQHSEQRGKKS